MMKLAFLVMAAVVMVTSAERAVGVGNPVIPSDRGYDKAPSFFLLNNAVMTDGVFYAAQAWFRNTFPASFQIWRPVCDVNGFNCSSRQFTLVGEVSVQPTTGDKSQVEQSKVEDVSIFL